MATCSFIKESKQTAGAMKGVMRYVSQTKKTLDEEGTRYLTGINCVADLAYDTFLATKNLYDKATGTFFYQYVQSFSPEEQISPEEAHKIALELAEKFFPGCEVLVATHIDAAHLHSHFIANSVLPDTGQKLHFTPRTLEKMRLVSDQLCREHGLTTLKPYQQKHRTKGLRTGEYRSAVRGQSWKFQLIATIELVMERTGSREEFIEEMHRRGYDVRWEDSRSSITYTTPSGMKCRDGKLHEEKFRKEKMEYEFKLRRRAEQQRLVRTEASGAGGADLDRTAGKYPLHDARADLGAAGGDPAADAGSARQHPHGDGFPGDEGEPGSLRNGGAAGRMAEPDGGPQSTEGPVHGDDPVGDAERGPTGWEEARRVYEETLRHRGDIPAQWQQHTGGLPREHILDDHALVGDRRGDERTHATDDGLTKDILHLMSTLEGEEPFIVDSTTRNLHGDRKALARERQKKIALGHRADDHEEGQKMV